jgi:outer membrane protein assembly factor BamA
VVLCVALLSVGRPLSAQEERDRTLARVEVIGARAFSEEELRKVLQWQEGAPYREEALEQAQARLLEKYRAAGRFFARLDPRIETQGGRVSVVLRVEEGPIARLREVSLVGVQALPAEAARRELGVRANRPFDAARWEKGIARLAERYHELGYPFVVLTTVPTTADPDTGDISLAVHVSEGARAVIERVEIEGLAKTREEVVRRLLGVVAGEPYDVRRIAAARHALVNSGFFTDVHPSLIQRGSAPERLVLRARVQEARTGRASGLLGYAPPRGEQDVPQVTGLLEAAERNLFGTGRVAEFRWESGENRTTHVAYVEPYAFGVPLDLQAQWDAETYSGVQRRGGSLRGDWRLSPFLRFGAGVQVLRTDAGTGWGMLMRAEWDSRDYRPNPAGGWLLRLQSDHLRGALRFDRLDSDLAVLLPVRPRHVVALRFRAGGLSGVDIPATEWYFLGGAASLRGYREREFPGRRRLLANLEYRILTGPDSHVFAFLDIGAVDRMSPRIGYGIGANLDSRSGLLRLDYGISRETSPLDGKVHIRLGTAF